MLINIALVLALIYFILGLKRAGLALITVPVACAVFVWAAFEKGDSEDAQVIVGVCVIFVATLASVLLSRCQPGLERWPQKWARRLLLGFTGLLFLVLLLMGYALIESNISSLAFPAMTVFFTIFLTIGALINYGLTSRRMNAAYVISTIGASMRQNLPLPMALESAASGSNDKRAIVLMNISKWLVRGCSIAESIKRGFPQCPSHALALITAAEPINQLPLAFQSIEADMAVKSDEERKLESVKPYYPAVLLLILFTVALLLMTFVIPNFTMVISEMTGDDGMPAPITLLLNISHFIMFDYGWAVTILPVGLLIFLWSYLKFLRRRPRSPRFSSRMVDFIKWHLPSLHVLEKSLSMVQVAEMLRLSLNAGCTVNNAIDRTLDLDINNCLRKRICQWLRRVEAGENISQAAKASRLPRPLAWAFDEKVNQGNTPMILETLESMYRSNYNCRVALIRAVLSPCITLALAATVGFVVYAIYSVPVEIIYRTAESVYP